VVGCDAEIRDQRSEIRDQRSEIRDQRSEIRDHGSFAAVESSYIPSEAKAAAMSLLVLAYTTVGGVVGAALTQYVTHLRDRRSARAAVVSNVAQVESALARRQSAETPVSQDIEQNFNEALAGLEGACLIAGVPRGILSMYIYACQIASYADELELDWTTTHKHLQRTKEVYDKAKKAIETLLSAIAISEKLSLLTPILTQKASEARSRDSESPEIAEQIKILDTVLSHASQLEAALSSASDMKEQVSQLETTLSKLGPAISEIEAGIPEVEAAAQQAVYLAKGYPQLHQNALQTLRRAIWHPLLVHIRVLMLRRLRNKADETDAAGRELGMIAKRLRPSLSHLNKGLAEIDVLAKKASLDEIILTDDIVTGIAEINSVLDKTVGHFS
jgi:uncharacterized phage infection (PIP) family protein YhgE